MARRVMIVAGEASGDAQAGCLAAALLESDPSLAIYGVGGASMREAGVDTIIDSAGLSMMGFAELSGGLGRVWACYRRLRSELRSEHAPDLLILVDFPDFNLRLARAAAKAGVRVFYYVSPQVWAWRRGRIRTICKWVDRMVVLFPFEKELYASHGLDVHFVGHPLAESVCASRTAEQTRARYGLLEERPLVALLPGSRRKEVEANLPAMLEAARRLGDAAVFAVARAPGLDRAVIAAPLARSGLDVAVVAEDTYNLVSASDVALTVSGTVTVECALLGCPMVVVYRMSPLSYALARMLVRVDAIAMPNIILGRSVVPELIQAAATPENMANEVKRYIDSPELRRHAAAELAEIRTALVKPGAAARAAALALETMA